MTEEQWNQILTTVYAPSLNTIILEFCKDGCQIQTGILQLPSFLQHSGGRVRSFELTGFSGVLRRGGPLPQLHLLSILNHLPIVEELHLIGIDDSIPSIVLKDISLLSRLRILKIDGSVTCSPHALAHVLRSSQFRRQILMSFECARTLQYTH
jgi:hypothetical protein